MEKYKYYEGDLYIKTIDTGWENISRLTKTVKDRDFYFKGLIRKELKQLGHEATAKHINNTFNQAMMTATYDGHVKMFDLDNTKTIFWNGYFDDEFNWVATHDTPFSPFQIDRDYNEDAKPSELVQKFFKELSGHDGAKEQLIFEIIGASMTPINWQIMPVLYSQHSTSGKGTLLEIIQACVGQYLTCDVKSDKWLGDNNNNFALSPIRNKLVAFVEELPHQLGKTSSEKIKDYVDSKTFVSIERKGLDQERVINTQTYVATSNNIVNVHNIDDSIIKRMVWVPLKMNQTGKAKFTKREIDSIIKSENDIDWITKKAMEAIAKVSKRSGVRNEKFTPIQDNINYWMDMQTNSFALEVVHSHEELNNLFDAKAEFIPVSILNEAFAQWKAKAENHDQKVTKMTFKKEFIGYLSSRKLAEASEGHNNKGNGRGIRVNWFTDEEHFMHPLFGRVTKEEAAILEEKAIANLDNIYDEKGEK